METSSENNHDSDTEMKSEAIASSISNGSVVQLTDSGDGESEMQAFMIGREKLLKLENSS